MISSENKSLITKFIQMHYTQSGMTEKEFSKFMLKCMGISASHSYIHNIRAHKLEIPVNPMGQALISPRHYEKLIMGMWEPVRMHKSLEPRSRKEVEIEIAAELPVGVNDSRHDREWEKPETQQM
jgi:hypothetical protein